MGNDFTELDDGTLLHHPKNELRIDAIWAFVSVDEDGNEGVIAASLPGLPGLTPLIAADERRLASIRTIAQMVVDTFGKPARLIKMTSREVLETIEPIRRS